MISFRKLLADDGAEKRLAWLVLEAVACHAVEADPAERLAFQQSLRQIVTRLEHSPSDGALVLIGEAIKSIETYNRSVQHSLLFQIKELQSIVSLFIRSMLQVSKGSVNSAAKLRQIEKQMVKSSQSEDLRALKSQVELSLGNICDEAAEQDRRSAQIGEQIRETMSRPESAALVSDAVSDLDLVTGLPNFRAAEQAIRSSIAGGTSTCAVLFCVDRLELINSRFGFSVGDRILMLFGQHLAQRFSKTDRLFRWRGPGFLALIDRSSPEMAIRAEIARIVSTRMEQEIELGGRTVLLPVAASWMLTKLDAPAEKISQTLDGFATRQSAGSATY